MAVDTMKLFNLGAWSGIGLAFTSSAALFLLSFGHDVIVLEQQYPLYWRGGPSQVRGIPDIPPTCDEVFSRSRHPRPDLSATPVEPTAILKAPVMGRRCSFELFRQDFVNYTELPF